MKSDSKVNSKRRALRTARKRFELRKQNSSASLLAAGIAHEFNNILGSVDGHAEWALDSGRVEDCVDALKSIREACLRSVQITRALQNFAQPIEESEQKVKVWKLVDDLMQEFQPRLRKSGIDFENKILENFVLVASPAKVAEIFRNLVKNSIEAMDVQDSSRKAIWIRSISESKIEIGDTGAGIPEVYQPFLFQPFFTTKGVLKHLSTEEQSAVSGFKGGMGLGLYRAKIAAAESGLELSLGVSDIQGTKWILKITK